LDLARWIRLDTARQLSQPTLSSRAGEQGSVDLDEDALARALLGRLDHGVIHAVRHRGQALGPTRVAEDLVAFLHVGEPVVQQGEHGGGDLLAETVAGAQILIDPDLHDSFSGLALRAVCSCVAVAGAISTIGSPVAAVNLHGAGGGNSSRRATGGGGRGN